MSLLASPSLLAFLIILISLITQSHAITLPHKIPVNDLRSKDCAFEFSGQRYNLCPLFRGGARRSVGAEVVHGEEWRWRIVYELVFAGGMDGVLVDSEPPCPEVTWFFMSATIIDWSSNEVENKDPSWFLTAVGGRRSVRTDAEVVVSLATAEGDNSLMPPFVLHLKGGIDDSMLWRSARIAFQCSLEGDDDLRFVGDRGGIHSFLWITQHGCPVEQRSSSKAAFQLSSAEDDSDDTSPPAEEEKKGEEVSEPNPRLTKIRGWTVAVFLLVVFVVICASALIVSPWALNVVDERLHALGYALIPAISRVAIVLEPLQKFLGLFSPTSLYHFGIRFRRGDSRHVQCAQEEMSLEEDITVNGASTYDGYGIPEDRWNADYFGEDIPLTIAPKWRPAVRKYGSTLANFVLKAPATVGGNKRFFRI